MDSFDNIMLIIDELIDEGIIMNLDSVTIIARATMKDTEYINITQNEGGSFSSVRFLNASLRKV